MENDKIPPKEELQAGRQSHMSEKTPEVEQPMDEKDQTGSRRQEETEPAGAVKDHTEENEQEEYAFLQEVIKDEAGSRKKRRRDILHVMVMGFVFGLVACFSFVAFRPWMEDRFMDDPDTVTIPPEQEPEKEEEEQPKEAPKVVLDAESYTQMLQSLQAVAKESRRSVATVTGYTGEEDWTKEQDNKKHSISGIIIADNGRELLVLGKILPTKDAKIIRVTFNDETQYEAVIKSENSALGLCIYAVRRSDISADTWGQINIATLGSSRAVASGDTAIVLGKPFGNGDAIGYGIVASNENYFDASDGQYQLIYTDVSGSAAGNGIITNIRGEVIGIIDVSVLGEENRNLIAGYGISDIKDVIELLSNGLPVPYVGVHGMDVTQEMLEQGLPQGVYIRDVETDSPAMSAGIQIGDIITQVGDDEALSLQAYHNILMRQESGQKIVIHGKRQGAGGEYVDIEFEVTIGAM